MISVGEHIDTIAENVLCGLKDFQRATVNRVIELYKSGQRRVLVSDEVGLGKTLVARGTVAKVAQWHKENGDPLFKVVYICSNGAIADQNLQKLRVADEVKTESVLSSRLSMQHLNIYRQEMDNQLLNRYIQLIPLTPDTSFRMTSGTGTVSERSLMFAHLRRLDALQSYLPELEVAMADRAHKAWEWWCKREYERAAVECDQKTQGRYFAEMQEYLKKELNAPWKEGKTYLDGIVALCEAIRANGTKRVRDTAIIPQLRTIFAKISLDRLDPDLVIMDEFQRFKYLLDAEREADTETGMLAKKFFNAKNVKMLLLSATPYKMYSTMQEIDDTNVDEHYREFLKVMDFLNVNECKKRDFTTVWHNYSIRLKELTQGDTSILLAKNDAEEKLYGAICRPERISEKSAADMINDKKATAVPAVSESDILSYVEMQKLTESISIKSYVPVDYVKSAPYLMSFMKDYQLKREVERYFAAHPDQLGKVKNDVFWLDQEKIDQYQRIPSNNARLAALTELVMEQNAFKLLWVPPCKTYYEPQGPYKGVQDFTKTLVFSSWEMVPRMLASMLSYEAERVTVGELRRPSREVRYFYTDDKRYPPARMNFVATNGNPLSMSLFCLIYPSAFLAKCFEPIAACNAHLEYQEIRRQIETKLRQELSRFDLPLSGRPDSRWYFLFPMMLDGLDQAIEWANAVKADLTEKKSEREKRLVEAEAIADGNTQKNANNGYEIHLDELVKLLNSMKQELHGDLGRLPDDFVEVVTNMAIASPAVCIQRTYEHYVRPGNAFSPILPTQAARAFLNRMNTVESTAVVEMTCTKDSGMPHWQSMLQYCICGNLQAVFDEYAHLISCGIDHDGQLIQRIHDQIMESITLRSSTYKVDTYPSFQRRMESKDDPDARMSMRTHFAVAFANAEEKEANINRRKAIRNAFNSPFRPFVLATTSIGQEGLDFHHYCRRIVHWNLPSNPIDLEQREGRINRFECLAIRQNVARRYGDIRFKKDIWDEMFEEAKTKEKKAGMSDLIPYWGLGKTDDMVQIERIVPMYPFSRDEQAYQRLIKILDTYRLTLGQARQEELLEYLFTNIDDLKEYRKLFMNLSPFYRDKEQNERINNRTLAQAPAEESKPVPECGSGDRNA